jgi:hypothetical protein
MSIRARVGRRRGEGRVWADDSRGDDPMKYMMLIANSEDEAAREPAAERAATYERIRVWWGEHAAAGRMIEGFELQPSATATTVRVDATGNATITDGPFVEAKEMIGGYGILEVADLDEALAVASSWPGSAAIEIRPVVESGA